MKAVLLSIKPKFCELIARGEKTIEIRKTKPKLRTPFKCYIYQTLPKCGDWNERDGRVIGEFLCDLIVLLDMDSVGLGMWEGNEFVYIENNGWNARLTKQEVLDYVGDNRPYGWHISNLIIYDKPKELSEFHRCCPGDGRVDCEYIGICDDCRYKELKQPPQSWRYVEEIETFEV